MVSGSFTIAGSCFAVLIFFYIAHQYAATALAESAVNSVIHYARFPNTAPFPREKDLDRTTTKSRKEPLNESQTACC